jgi:hypothetical protein
VTFADGTASTECLAWMLVPRDAAFAAAVELFRTGQRPTPIECGDP